MKKINPMVIVGIVLLVLAGGYFLVSSSQTKPAVVDDDDEKTAVSTIGATNKDKGEAMEKKDEKEDKEENEEVEKEDEEETDVKNITIEVGSFYFKPNIINVKKGQKVKVTLKAVSLIHNFTIDELKVNSPTVKNGETQAFEFTADKAGEFEYYCSVGQHRQNGQVGKLIVK